MKYQRIFPGLLLQLGLLLMASTGMAATQGKMLGAKQVQPPGWFKESFLDITEDVAEAGDEDKHVILFLHMNGCPYCYKMGEENFKHAPYKEFIQEHFDVIALNVNGDREVALNEDLSLTEKRLADHLKVSYTPTVLFLNSDNKQVARINGYRSVPDFKLILDYVQQKAYERTTVSRFLAQAKSRGYQFLTHPQLQLVTDLQAVAEQPLALMFEDSGCVDCEALHNGHLKAPEVQAILKNFTFVRLDADSSEPIKDVEGNPTTPKAYAEKLGLDYRPGIVLFDKGREIVRIESMLYRYHFQEILRYVGERHYETYPDSPFDYVNVKTAELLKAGQDVSISE